MMGQGSLHTFYYLITLQVVLVTLLGMYTAYMADLHCPRPEVYGLNENITVTQSNIWFYINSLLSGCTGIPWWIYVIIFLPIIIAVLVYVIPNWIIGGG